MQVHKRGQLCMQSLSSSTTLSVNIADSTSQRPQLARCSASAAQHRRLPLGPGIGSVTGRCESQSRAQFEHGAGSSGGQITCLHAVFRWTQSLADHVSNALHFCYSNAGSTRMHWRNAHQRRGPCWLQLHRGSGTAARLYERRAAPSPEQQHLRAVQRARKR